MTKPLLTIVLLATVQVAPPPSTPQPPVGSRDDARPASRTGTAIIRGRVTDQETGQPVARATVVLMSAAITRPRGDGPLQGPTSKDGRYEFRDLPAGEYSVMVQPGEHQASHLAQVFGEDRPTDMWRMSRPRQFALADSEVREDVNVALSRALAIEGRVVDELGEPMAGVSMHVNVAGTDRPAGRQGPYQFPSDDRGFFRIYGLGPGRYTVCATPQSHHGGPSTEIRERHIKTCFPAAVVDADAQAIDVANGDVGGVEIRVQRSRAFTVSGTAVDSSGAPLEQGVNLMQIEGTGGSSSGLLVQPGGGFIARGLTPGEYAIHAETGSRFNPNDTREREMAYVPFRIDTSDIEGLLVATKKTSKVAGHVVFEDTSSIPAAGSMHVTARRDMANRMMMMMGPPPDGQVKPDLTFELSGLFGPVAVALNGAPRGWVVRAVRYRAQDITGMLVDFSGGRETDVLEVVLTNRVARVSGRVTDERGSPASDARVMILPADRARWSALNVFAGGAGLKPDGRFQLGPVRAGEYLIVAVPFAEMPPMPLGPDYLERVASVAQRITLAENEQQTIDLRVAKLR